MNEDIDRLLAYRNFLAAEDHLDELLSDPTYTASDRSLLTALKYEIEFLRDNVMPEERNKHFHCLVKHLSLAYEATREIAKATHKELDAARANATRSLLNAALEELWGRKIINCERCGVKEEDAIATDTEPEGISGTDGSSDADPTDDGLSGDLIQGVSSDREPSVPSGKATGSGGAKPS